MTTMSNLSADEGLGAVGTGAGIDRAGNDAAVRDTLLGPEADGSSQAAILPCIDPVTGEVSGTGSGTGGGNAGEDHDDDHTAGSNTLK